MTKLSSKQEKECRKAFDIWNRGSLSFASWGLYRGWKACYSWMITKEKREFDESLDEMYNSYKQDNPKLGLK